MANESVTGADSGQIDQNGTSADSKTVEKPVVGISKEELDAKIAEINKTWQSRFDTVLGEKKAVEGKAMTVEQRMEQLEREREAERLGFAREKAKLGAKIEDELDGAIRLYSSSKPEEIASGAEAIRGYFEKMRSDFEAEKQQAIQDALAKAGAQPRPKGGQDENPGDLKAQYEQAVKDGKGELALSIMEKMQAKNRR